jgi:hypothetical protein
MLNVVGDFSYTGASTEAMPTFKNLSGVASLTVKGAGSYDFSGLVSAGNVVLNNAYPSKTTVLAFDKLKTYTSFSDDDAGSAALNRVKFSNATNLHLTAVTVLTGSKLDVTIDEGGTLKLDGLTGLTSADVIDVVDLDIEGPTSVALTTIQAGNINLKDVKTASISNFYGAIVIDSGVENLTVVKGVSLDISAAADLEIVDINMVTNYASTAVAADALAAAYKAITFKSQDLTTVKLSGKIGALDATAQNNLTSIVLADATHVTSLVAKDNNDLNTLTVTGATIGNVTLDNNDNFTEAVLNHTSYVTATDLGVAISVINNDDLVTLRIHASKVDDLKIQTNSDLTTLDFGTGTAALDAIGGTTANVAINNNDLTATLAKDSYNAAAAADAGSYVTTSGLKGLKTYLDAAIAAPGTAGVKVFFDNISAYQVQSGSATAVFTDTTVPAVDYTTGTSNPYAVAFITANTSDQGDAATATKRSYLISNAVETLGVVANGVSILGVSAAANTTSATLGAVNAVTIAALINTTSLAQADVAGVSIAATANAGPVAYVEIGVNTTAAENSATAASSAWVFGVSDSFTISIDGYSATVTFTQYNAAGGTTNTDLAEAFTNQWIAKYGAAGSASQSAVRWTLSSDTTNAQITNDGATADTRLSFTAKDTGTGSIDDAISVTFTAGGTTATHSNVGWAAGNANNTTISSADNKAQGTGVLLTVTADTKGDVLGEIGVPLATAGVGAKALVVKKTAAGTVSELSSTYNPNITASNATTALNLYPAEGRRNDVIVGDEKNEATGSNAKTDSRALWLL